MTAKKRSIDRRTWADRKNVPAAKRRPGHFANVFPPDTTHLSRGLTDKELLVLLAYKDHYQSRGNTLQLRRWVHISNAYAQKHQLDTRITADDIEELFLDLFPHNPDIYPTSAALRLTGIGRTDFSRAECHHSLLTLSDELTKKAKEKAREQAAAPDAEQPVVILRVFPNTNDVRDKSRSGEIIPELGCPMPSWETIRNSYDADTWRKALEQMETDDKSGLYNRIVIRVGIKDLVADYTAAYTHFYGLYDPNDPHIVSTMQLDEFKKFGGLGKSRYDHCLKRINKIRAEQGRPLLSIDDVRRKARFPVNPHRSYSSPRDTSIAWPKPEIYAAYKALWDKRGKQGAIDTIAYDLAYEQQTEIMRTHDGKIDAKASHAAQLPFVQLPSRATIAKKFGGFIELMGYAEQVSKKPMNLTPQQLETMAVEVSRRLQPVEIMPSSLAVYIQNRQASNTPRNTTQPLPRLRRIQGR